MVIFKDYNRAIIKDKILKIVSWAEYVIVPVLGKSSQAGLWAHWSLFYELQGNERHCLEKHCGWILLRAASQVEPFFGLSHKYTHV